MQYKNNIIIIIIIIIIIMQRLTRLVSVIRMTNRRRNEVATFSVDTHYPLSSGFMFTDRASQDIPPMTVKRYVPSRFRLLRWPHGHADQLVRLPA